MNEADRPELEVRAPKPAPGAEAFWGYHDLVLFAGLAIPALLLGALVVKGLLFAAGIRVETKALELLPAQFLGYALLFSGLALILKIQYRRPFWRSLGFRRPALPLRTAVLLGIAVAFAVAALGAALRTPDIQTPLRDLLANRRAVLAVGIVAVTLGPLSEELAFRGFLQPLLSRSLGAAAGIWLSALPFGLLHLPEYAWSWRHGLLIVCAGAAFGWMRHYSGSTLAATVMHAAYNLTLFLGYLVQGKDLPKTW
jgi:membrane protease YdiL (CAAX protease family)